MGTQNPLTPTIQPHQVPHLRDSLIVAKVGIVRSTTALLHTHQKLSS
ncbi:hypothetical protein HDF17_000923 [Granulicella arctica]|uniref:Uncharacterized protein n=1 Tax=Granulicella arctica TaxID=940613 RepID=A0A7Y9PGB7_9BACT|nr:hypothetical protein [Granulicella arctica]